MASMQAASLNGLVLVSSSSSSCPHRILTRLLPPSYSTALRRRTPRLPLPPRILVLVLFLSRSRSCPRPPFARCRNNHRSNHRRSQWNLLTIKQSQKTSTTTNSKYSTVGSHLCRLICPYNTYIPSQTICSPEPHVPPMF
jgi:hypothetical protein